MALIVLAVQTQELQDLIDLGKDAADILWEMAALHEETPGTKDVIDNVKLLQVCPNSNPHLLWRLPVLLYSACILTREWFDPSW